MKKKKLLSVLLAGAMSASIFVGCGSSATDWDYISNKGEITLFLQIGGSAVLQN